MTVTFPYEIGTKVYSPSVYFDFKGKAQISKMNEYIIVGYEVGIGITARCLSVFGNIIPIPPRELYETEEAARAAVELKGGE